MKHVVAFFVGAYHRLLEAFSDDATGKLSWQSFIGIALAYELASYIGRQTVLTDPQFLGLIALIALLVYGPAVNLMNFYKSLGGGFKQAPETAIVTDNTQVDSTNTTVNSPPVEDINNPSPQPGR